MTRKSLNLMWKNYLSNDWLPPDKAYNFSVEKFYVDLKWVKMVKEALKTVKKDLTSIYDVVMAAGDGGTNILVQGIAFLNFDLIMFLSSVQRFTFVKTEVISITFL